MKTVDSSLDGMLADYRLSLEAANRSPKTISWYMDILHRFFSFLEEGGSSISVNEIGREEVRAYIKHLQEAERWANKPRNGKDRGKDVCLLCSGAHKGDQGLLELAQQRRLYKE